MADVSKCAGVGCPVRELCRRFTAPAEEYLQSYIEQPNVEENGCDMFLRDSEASLRNKDAKGEVYDKMC